MTNTFQHHLDAAILEGLSEGRDVFSMMRNRIVNAQIDQMMQKDKKLSAEKVEEIRNQMQDELKNAPTTEIVRQYTLMTGKGDPVEQPSDQDQPQQ